MRGLQLGMWVFHQKAGPYKNCGSILPVGVLSYENESLIIKWAFDYN